MFLCNGPLSIDGPLLLHWAPAMWLCKHLTRYNRFNTVTKNVLGECGRRCHRHYISPQCKLIARCQNLVSAWTWLQYIQYHSSTQLIWLILSGELETLNSVQNYIVLLFNFPAHLCPRLGPVGLFCPVQPLLAQAKTGWAPVEHHDMLTGSPCKSTRYIYQLYL